jgi:hypothetical protein
MSIERERVCVWETKDALVSMVLICGGAKREHTKEKKSVRERERDMSLSTYRHQSSFLECKKERTYLSVVYRQKRSEREREDKRRRREDFTVEI